MATPKQSTGRRLSRKKEAMALSLKEILSLILTRASRAALAFSFRGWCFSHNLLRSSLWGRRGRDVLAEVRGCASKFIDSLANASSELWQTFSAK